MSLFKTIKLPTGKDYEQPLGLYINGEWRAAKEGKTIEVINPSTEEVIVAVHEATEAVSSTLPLLSS